MIMIRIDVVHASILVLGEPIGDHGLDGVAKFFVALRVAPSGDILAGPAKLGSGSARIMPVYA